MIRLDFEPSLIAERDPEFWARWSVRAESATARVAKQISTHEQPTFDDSVWSELKQWLFDNVFHGKCAYCEGRVTPQSFGDAEHWRPKGKVTVRDDGRLQQVERGQAPHPGYWWLAYEPTNLLPACQRCNSGNGKNTQFPVGHQHAFAPAEAPTVDNLDDFESPLLLHPFRGEDPAKHLTIDDFGKFSPTHGSELGRASIDVFDLNRGKLCEDRFQRMQEAEEALPQALVKVLGGITLEEALRRWTNDSAPYAATIREFVAREVKSFRQRL